VAVEGLTARETFIVLSGAAITILSIKSGVYLWNHDFRLGILYLTLSGGLAFLIFRRRRVIFALIALIFVLVNVGLTTLFHPSLLGTLLTAGSLVGLYLIVSWSVGRDPKRRPKNMHKLFDNDKES